jgi:hypothetical protein
MEFIFTRSLRQKNVTEKNLNKICEKNKKFVTKNHLSFSKNINKNFLKKLSKKFLNKITIRKFLTKIKEKIGKSFLKTFQINLRKIFLKN